MARPLGELSAKPTERDLLLQTLIDFSRFLAVGLMFSIGLGVIVVTGKIRNKEIAVPDFLITLRCQSSLDRGKARVRDGPGGQAGAG